MNEQNIKDSEKSILQLRQALRKNLEAVDQEIISRLNKSIPLISDIGKHLINTSGKRLRPLLTLAMAAQFNNYSKNPILLAAAVEFIHTATLLHDDVVDESNLRRGKKTANTIWGNEFCVLAGDFLLSGYRLIGKVTCYQGGHELTNLFLRIILIVSHHCKNLFYCLIKNNFLAFVQAI